MFLSPCGLRPAPFPGSRQVWRSRLSSSPSSGGSLSFTKARNLTAVEAGKRGVSSSGRSMLSSPGCGCSSEISMSSSMHHGSSRLSSPAHGMRPRAKILDGSLRYAHGFALAHDGRHHAANGVGDVVMRARRVVDAVAAAARRAALQALQLRRQLRMVEQLDALGAEQRNAVAVNVGFRFLRGFVSDAMSAEALDGPLASVAVAADAMQIIAFQRLGEFATDIVG